MDALTRLFFYNPSEQTLYKIIKYIEFKGFKKRETSAWKDAIEYRRGESYVRYQIRNDCFGIYMEMRCEGIEIYDIHKILCKCPNCNSSNSRVRIFPKWSNDKINQLDNDRVVYLCAYDRIGTMPYTKLCLDCGFNWYNDADWFYWSDVVSKGIELDEKILGINDSKKNKSKI